MPPELQGIIFRCLLLRRTIYLLVLEFSLRNFHIFACCAADDIRDGALTEALLRVHNVSWPHARLVQISAEQLLIRVIAAAWNADTQHGTHGSRGLLEVRGTQSGNPRRSGHYLTVRR